MANPMLHPQFFSTLLPGFHTHLTIPLDFFSKYIQGKSVEMTAQLKSDASDISWEVKMTSRRLCSGWEDFALAQNLRIGHVIVVRYEGDLVFRVSDLGTSCCQILDIPPSSNNKDVSGRTLLTKRVHPFTQPDCSSDDGDNIELPRNKKAKKNVPEAETVSSSPDNSSFVALVTASNLRTDTLYLSQHFTSSNGLTRECHKIVLIDEGERSWVLDLRFNKSSDTFYISRGWRHFCNENGQEAGGFFMFKLVKNGKTPVLSFCPTESVNDRRKRDWSESSRRESVSTELNQWEENIDEESSADKCSEEDSIEEESSEDECSEEENIGGESSEDESSGLESLRGMEEEKYSLKRVVPSYSSYSPYHKEFVKFTLPPDYARIKKLCLPGHFVRENGINKHGDISLMGKDGTKWLTKLLLDRKGTVGLGKGWKDFVNANSLTTGFTLKLIWEDTTPVLSLCSAESCSGRGHEEFSKARDKQSHFLDPGSRDKNSNDVNNKEQGMSLKREKNHLRWRDSSLSSQKEFVTLTITPGSFKKCRLHLPANFTRVNDINKHGMITLLGKDGIKQPTKLLYDKGKGTMGLGIGWKDFVKANGLNTGDSFTLKLGWDDTTPVLSLCPAGCNIDKGIGEGCSETNQEKCHPMIPRSCETITISEDENSKHQFVTLTITSNILGYGRLRLPAQFVRENGIKPGDMYLLDRDGRNWLTNLQMDKKGTTSLVKGWKDFAEANGLKSGKSFTLELIWVNASPMLRLFRSESISSKMNEEFISLETRSSDSSSAITNRSVTLTLTPEDVRACQMHLPSHFMRANGINKLGKITLLGKDKMKWC